MSYPGRKYSSFKDPAMWGAPRRIGWVIGGMPLAVAHELLADLIPGYYSGTAGQALNIRHLFSDKPAIVVLMRRPGGDREEIKLPREKVADWLDDHYSEWRSGFPLPRK